MSKLVNRSRLETFFSPQRIAVVGASERGMYPAGIIQNLLAYGYTGEIYPVNPKHQTVFGLTCYPDVTQTPVPADLAVIVVPRGAVVPVLKQCLTAGVPAAVVITAGFAEADETGRRLQTQMAELVARGRISIVGPNCAGLANIPGRVIATRLPVLHAPGNVSFISQSGALMMALYGVFVDRHIGMSRLLSLGNQVDVTLADGLEYLVDEPQTEVIAAFVEGVQDGRRFVHGLRKALRAGKPVILVKSGRTAQGQKAAATHTAALAGPSKVFDAVCEQFGAVRVDDVVELMDTVQIFAAFGKRMAGAGNLAVVTQSGGLGSLTADLSALAGLNLPPLNPTVERRLRTLPHIMDIGALANPTDVRGASVIGPTTAATLTPFLEDPTTDFVLLLLAKSAVRQQDAETARAIIRVAQKHDKPLAVVWTGQRYPAEPGPWPLAHRLLVEAGIPLFDQPSNAVRAIARAAAYWQLRAAWLSDPEVLADEP